MGLGAALFALGYGTGRYLQPAKIKVETKTEQLLSYRDRIVHKKALDKHEVVTTVKKPDGEVQIVRTTDTHSATDSTTTNKTTETTKQSQIATASQGPNKSLSLSVGPEYSFREFDGLKLPDIGASLQWRPTPLPIVAEVNGILRHDGRLDGSVGAKLILNY